MLQWTFCRVWLPYLQSCPAVPCHYNELFSEPTEILLRCMRNKSHHLWTNLSHSYCLSYQRTHKSCPNLTRVKQSWQMIQMDIALLDLSCWNIGPASPLYGFCTCVKYSAQRRVGWEKELILAWLNHRTNHGGQDLCILFPQVDSSHGGHIINVVIFSGRHKNEEVFEKVWKICTLIESYFNFKLKKKN